MEFLGLYGLDTVIIIVFAVAYYKAAEIENASRLLWTGLSVIISLLTRFLGLGLIALILGQVLLFLGIAVVRFLVSKGE